MDNVLVKVQALFALTASSNIDEARNAAYAAVKLIQQHGLVVSMGAPSHGTTFPTPTVTVKVNIPRRRRTPVEVYAEQQEAAQRARDRQAHEDFQSMKAKYKGNSKGCNRPIRQNTPIYWSKDKGAYHPICFLRAE